MTRMRIVIAALLLAVLAGGGFWWAHAHAASPCSALKGLQQRECWRNEIVSALDAKGVDAAFTVLAGLYETNPTFSTYCHDYAHLIGNAAYEQFSKNKQTQLSPRAAYCGYGFYHGFMEALLYTTGDMEQARDFCAYAQEQLGGDAKGACYHGIGHGFLDGTNRDGWGDPEQMVKAGLSLCERVGEDAYFINRCASGVFNSLAILSDNPSQADSITIDTHDPYGVCRLQTKEYFKTPCYEEMGTLVYRINDGNLTQGAAQVAKITDNGNAASAMESLVSYSARFSAKHFDTAAAAKFCNGLEERLRIPCIKGFGTGLAEFGAPGQEYVKSIAFCQSGNLTPAEQHECLGRLMPYLKIMYSASRMQEICGQALEPVYRQEFCT